MNHSEKSAYPRSVKTAMVMTFQRR